MTSLVTGGAGHIGAQVVRKLVEQGERVIVFDTSPNFRFLSDIIDSITFVRGDVVNFSEILDTVRVYDVTHIYHAAALLSGVARLVPLPTAQVNAIGTVNIFEASRVMNVERVVFTSTAGVFSDWSQDVSDDSEKYPISPYGATKVLGELYGLWYYYTYKLDFRGVRFALVFGTGDAYAYHERSRIIENPALGKPVHFSFRGDRMGNWLYVKDAAQSLIHVLNAHSSQVKTRIYNIGGVNATMQQVADIVKKFIPEAVIEFSEASSLTEPHIRFLDSNVTERHTSFLDTNARNELGWKPTYSLERGIKETIELTRRNPHLYSKGVYTKDTWV